MMDKGNQFHLAMKNACASRGLHSPDKHQKDQSCHVQKSAVEFLSKIMSQNNMLHYSAFFYVPKGNSSSI